jgi:hypothetical protein
MTKKRRKAASSAKDATSGSKAEENEPKTTTTSEIEPAPDSSGTWSHLYREGREALERIRSGRDYADWGRVADALDAARSEAMTTAGTNTPIGSRYYKAFGEVRKREGLHTDKVDSATRNLLFKIVKHRIAIEEWRQTLDPKRRSQMNFPRVVLKNWEKTPAGHAALNPSKKSDAIRSKSSRKGSARDQAQLLNENIELEERVTRLSAERDQLKRETTAEFTDLTRVFAALVTMGRTLVLADLPRDIQASDLRELADRIGKLAAEVEAARAEETVQ